MAFYDHSYSNFVGETAQIVASGLDLSSLKQKSYEMAQIHQTTI